MKYEHLLCQLRWYESKFFSKELIGWYYPKGSVLRPIFDELMSKQKESGIIDYLNKKYFTAGLKESQCDAKIFNQIGFEFVAILFYIFASGAAFAVFVCLLEFMYKKKH